MSGEPLNLLKNLLFSHKQYTQRIRSAMACYRTARGGFQDLIKAGAQLVDLIPYVLYDLLAAFCVGDKDTVLVDVVPVNEPVGDVVEDYSVD